ncbi:glycoside hydrolase family 95-like protein [Paenibacillus methanolicus]|uniref:Alpha fucosidase A-like C-terminal domain-containing protein n=1 Tax=Paenibacillus methanolicus TaxID=582686 RepID=A0A5S5CGV4_9BACL|nr:hypothetical protein [Paenibacillus methanolicus]TYP77466.1 hypothetical protein BCM02_10226 [Paenibacillus methanolicus]
MNKALVYARLKNGSGVVDSLLPMMTDQGYYASLMTDHDTNRRCDSYCTDTLFGTMGAINEALLFSNTGEIEVLPAQPPEWKAGAVYGLMARTRVEVKQLVWDLVKRGIKVTLHSISNANKIKLKAGIPWFKATVNGCETPALADWFGKHVHMTLESEEDVTVGFDLNGES